MKGCQLLRDCRSRGRRITLHLIKMFSVHVSHMEIKSKIPNNGKVLLLISKVRDIQTSSGLVYSTWHGFWLFRATPWRQGSEIGRTKMSLVPRGWSPAAALEAEMFMEQSDSQDQQETVVPESAVPGNRPGQVDSASLRSASVYMCGCVLRQWHTTSWWPDSADLTLFPSSLPVVHADALMSPSGLSLVHRSWFWFFPLLGHMRSPSLSWADVMGPRLCLFLLFPFVLWGSLSSSWAGRFSSRTERRVRWVSFVVMSPTLGSQWFIYQPFWWDETFMSPSYFPYKEGFQSKTALNDYSASTYCLCLCSRRSVAKSPTINKDLNICSAGILCLVLNSCRLLSGVLPLAAGYLCLIAKPVLSLLRGVFKVVGRKITVICYPLPRYNGTCPPVFRTSGVRRVDMDVFVLIKAACPSTDKHLCCNECVQPFKAGAAVSYSLDAVWM